MSDDTALTLAELPSDVIRKIASFTLESTQSMRMISPRWNTLAFSRRPALEHFCWEIDAKWTTLTMSLPRAYRNYLGVESWQEFPNIDRGTVTVVWSAPFTIKIPLEKRVTQTAALLKKSASITKLYMKFPEIFRLRTTVLDVLRAVSVQKLVFLEFKMIHFIRRNRTAIIKFLDDVSRLVDSIDVMIIEEIGKYDNFYEIKDDWRGVMGKWTDPARLVVRIAARLIKASKVIVTITMTSSNKSKKRERTDDLYADLSGKYSLLSVSDSDEEVELNISTLPSLIIRKIIKLEPESVQTMKMISPRWYAHVSDLLKHGHLQAGIKLFHWQKDFHGKTTLTVQLPRKFVCFFGLESWRVNRQSLRSDPEQIIELVADFLPEFNEAKLFSRIGTFLKLCSRIEKIVLNMDFFRQTVKEVEVIRDALKNIFIDELVFTGILYFNEAKYSILNIVQNNQVCDLKLSVFDITRIKFGKFFTKAAQSVPSIDLLQNGLTPYFDLARAVVPWQEALQLLKADPTIKASLETTRRRIQTQIQIKVKKREIKNEEDDN